MANKVVFLAYSNSVQEPLPTLSKESDGVYSVLIQDRIKSLFEIHIEQFATPESLNKYIKFFKNSITIFNYSGHAGNNNFLLNDIKVLSDGIAYQLEESAKLGILKLVILNGCSTVGQVKTLLKIGIPVVIATYAPINDYSASEFAIRFFQGLCEDNMNIKQAYFSALKLAQNMTEINLNIGDQKERGLGTLEDIEENKPLWGLFYLDKDVLEMNPLTYQNQKNNNHFVVNKLLQKTLFDTLYQSGNEEIAELKEREFNQKYVEEADKIEKIINVVPMPIGEQLRKLLCPTSIDNLEEGYDKLNINRINQICKVFHVTTELLGCIMLSQLWEEKLKPENEQPPELLKISEALLDKLREHFYLTANERASYDYLPLIREIRLFFDSLHGGRGIKYFIDELNELKDIAREDSRFISAYQYLSETQKLAVAGKVPTVQVPEICEKAEVKLSDFFSYLGFLHRYSLTSIQNISILKYRHSRKAIFNHSVVKLMRVGGSGKFQYQWSHYMDNQGVVLLKGNIHLVNSELKQFVADDNLEFLNLSPFIMETSAFEPNTEKARLSIFDQYLSNAKTYKYKSFTNLDNPRDVVEVGRDSTYTIVKEELDDYRKTILNESF